MKGSVIRTTQVKKTNKGLQNGEGGKVFKVPPLPYVVHPVDDISDECSPGIYRETLKEVSPQESASGGGSTGVSSSVVAPRSVRRMVGKNRDGNGNAYILRVRGFNFAPPRLSTTLTFSGFTTITAAAAHAANVRFTPTFAYDVDPTLGSTAMAGFSEYAGLYRYYRVQGARVRVHFASLEATQNCVVYVAPVNIDPGANYSTSVAQQYLANPNTKIAIVGPINGKGVAVIKHNVLTSYFGGAWNHNVADNYSGLTAGAAAPTNNWYLTVGILGTANVSTGVTTLTTIDLDIEFFELTSPAT